MEWHWLDSLSVFHHFPHSVGDLIHHEDKALIKAGLPGLSLKKPIDVKPSSISAVEKDIDPAISRSQQNFGLLIHDYLHTLPEYTAETKQAEALLEHWRKILLEQPQRLAEAHMHSWNNDHSRNFWHERLSNHKNDFGVSSDHFPIAMDDWERSAGTTVMPLKAVGIMQTKQWQDLVIRQRLHNLDLANMSRYQY